MQNMQEARAVLDRRATVLSEQPRPRGSPGTRLLPVLTFECLRVFRPAALS